MNIMALNIEIINGKKKNMADVIIENGVTFESCVVASYGFGVKQINKLIAAFDSVFLIADDSHSKLNSNVYKSVVEMSKRLNHFYFRSINVHAKFAIIDNSVFMMTSANLSNNQKYEIYCICNISDVSGIDELKRFFVVPEKLDKKELIAIDYI